MILFYVCVVGYYFVGVVVLWWFVCLVCGDLFGCLV